MSARRLPDGGRIDRAEALRFTWDGAELTGHPGDTLASALLAGGVQLIGRSFKYHRPRGVMSAGVEESGALVTVAGAGDGARRDPNVKATVQELYAGLAAAGQNAWPNVRFDLGAAANRLSRFLPAGFYYKTFMGPRIKGGTTVWMLCEKFIRRAAGMGAASRLPDPDQYEHAHAFCDVLVVGGGPAGLAAAATAARAGLDVLLVEQDFQLGGDLLNQPLADAGELLAEMLDDARSAGVRAMTRTTAFGLYDGCVAGLIERVTDHLADPAPFLPRQRFWTVRARRIIVAAGALERHFAFGNNDRPGVMGAAAARAYLNRYAVLPGERIVVATNNDSAYPVAGELAAAGAAVEVLDARPADRVRQLAQQAGARGITVRPHCAPLRAVGARRVKALEVAMEEGGRWRHGGRQACDAVLVSGGWSPAIHLISHLGGKPRWNRRLACFTADANGESLLTAGAAAAIWDTGACRVSGQAAGAAAARALGKDAPGIAMPAPGGWRSPIRPLYEVRVPGAHLKSMVDPLNDVTADDVRLAHREGFTSVEHLKRYTTLGMSADGGKMGNVIGLALMAEALGRASDGDGGDGADPDIAAVGATTFRPPYTPVALGALRGRSVGGHFRPLRRTPMHQWNLERGAVMTIAGLWERPWYYPRHGETLDQAYIREAATVRESVGLCDVTSLGKIAVQGPDAAAFLDRIYTNRFAHLPVGKARYGIMLRDDGLVLDDGTTWRLSETDYFMTTTTAHAATVMAWLEELLQVRWPALRVHVASVSDQWAGCAVAGPKSHRVLSACADSPEALTDHALPFMGVGRMSLGGGIPCRIARISFSGELAYEVYAPSDYATAMMDALWAAAEAAGGCLYGLEALGALRIEKGHVTGAELDGRVTLDDAGLGRMAAKGKAFIGSTLRARPELQREDRPKLVGIRPKDRAARFNAGAILCRPGQLSGLGEGWVTAVTHSPALGHWIGIGFIRGGEAAWRGQSAVAADPVRAAPVEVDIISPHMFDPDGARMRG
ncbi:MAG: sarcosine oxidase subunit alpha family protein [Gammaproteobacteria bacterium]|nr:sarcosine oxidase subunit alpha family protein [Gammaproteobacteria bacterium]